MPRVIVLDTFPLSSTAKPGPRRGSPPGLSDQCRDWVGDCIRAGNRVVAPAVCYYETLCELERLQAPGQIHRLRQFCLSVPDRYLSLTDAHLELAAKLWAQARNAGTPTAGADSLDVDVLLAAQALLLGVPPGDLVDRHHERRPLVAVRSSRPLDGHRPLVLPVRRRHALFSPVRKRRRAGPSTRAARVRRGRSRPLSAGPG